MTGTVTGVVASAGATPSGASECTTAQSFSSLPYEASSFTQPRAEGDVVGSCTPADASHSGAFTWTATDDEEQLVVVQVTSPQPFTLSVVHECTEERGCIPSSPVAPTGIHVAVFNTYFEKGRNDIIVDAAEGTLDEAGFSVLVQEQEP